MELIDQVRKALAEGIKGFPKLEIADYFNDQRVNGACPEDCLEVRTYPGEFGKWHWEVYARIGVRDGVVEIEEYGMSRDNGDGCFDWQADLNDEGSDLPEPVRKVGLALRDAVEALDLPSMGLSAPVP